jgi:AraC family transcriptional regulator
MKLRPGHFYGETSNRCEIAEFSVMNANYAPGLKLPRHSHTRACFSVVLEGALSETYGGRSLVGQPLSVGFNAPDEEHSNFIHNTGARFLIVEISPGWLRRVDEYSKALRQSFVLQSKQLGYLGLRLYREATHIDSVSPLAIEGLLFETVAATSRLDAKRKADKYPRWLDQARELIHAHFADSLTLTGIAQTVGIHPVHLSRVFRTHYHSTIGDYIRQLRIDFVCRELSATSTSLAEIAYKAGFYDQGHLSRTFKRFTGMTPTQYRASNRSR